jgi:hypothetical protein
MRANHSGSDDALMRGNLLSPKRMASSGGGYASTSCSRRNDEDVARYCRFASFGVLRLGEANPGALGYGASRWPHQAVLHEKDEES